MRMIVGVNAQFVYYALKDRFMNARVPYRDIIDLVESQGDDVLEVYAPVIRFPPSSDDPQDVAKSFDNYARVASALQQQGVNVIEAPARQTSTGVKHSDDQRLMIRLALSCARLRPDFLVLVAADGDYAPLVWGLREEGIRTKLITDPASLSPDLRAAVYSVSNIFNVLPPSSPVTPPPM